MSTNIYLFNRATRECLYLGKHGVPDDRFDGPVCYIDDESYLLPQDLLGRLIDRFNDGGDDGDVIMVASEVLFDTYEYLDEGEDVVEVGGDTDIDVPLAKYLPELDTEEGKKLVRSHGTILREPR